MHARRGWLGIGLLAAACATPFACTFLSDFPDVETEPGASTTSSTSGIGGSGASTSSDASAGSTGSGVCGLPAPCAGASCALPDLPSMLVAKPTDAPEGETHASVRGLAKLGNDVIAYVGHNATIEGTPSNVSPEASYYLHGAFVARVTPQPSFIARTFECHVPNGALYAGSVATTGDRIFFGVTSPGQTQPNTMPAQLVLSDAPTNRNCMTPTVGQPLAGGDLVPFLAEVDAEGPRALRAATDGATASMNGVDAAYLATAARADTLAVLGVFAQPAAIFGKPCPASACYFIATFDTSGGGLGAPTIDVLDVVPNGELPDLDSIFGDIAIDDAGNIWAAGATTTEMNRAFVYLRKKNEAQGIHFNAAGTSDSYALGLTTRGTRAYVAGFAEGGFSFGSFAPTARGGSDMFVLAFDAETFDGQPEWGFPATTEDLPFGAQPDILEDIAVVDVAGCEPHVFVTGCVGRNGGLCRTGAEETELLILRLDGEGKLVRASQIPAEMSGSLRGRRILVDDSATAPGLWVGMDARGRAFGFNSTGTAGDLNPFAIVARFPL